MKTSIQYIADDGTSFNREEECRAYEDELKRRDQNASYFYLLCGADCTEGRGFTQAAKYKVPFKFLATQYMTDFLYRTLGNQVDYIQGVSATPAWILTEIDRAEFERSNNHMFGDYKSNVRTFVMKLGDAPNGLQIDE
jgi:hypothetical protein